MCHENSHACCEDKRPCSRCLAHGLECQDQVGKKRGRKKKAGSDNDESQQDSDPEETQILEKKKKKKSKKNKPKLEDDQEFQNHLSQKNVNHPNQQLIIPVNTNNSMRISESELKTPGAMLASGNALIYPNGDK